MQANVFAPGSGAEYLDLPREVVHADAARQAQDRRVPPAVCSDEEQWFFQKLRYCGPVTEELQQLGYASYVEHYVRRFQQHCRGDELAFCRDSMTQKHLQSNLKSTAPSLRLPGDEAAGERNQESLVPVARYFDFTGRHELGVRDGPRFEAKCRETTKPGEKDKIPTFVVPQSEYPCYI